MCGLSSSPTRRLTSSGAQAVSLRQGRPGALSSVCPRARTHPRRYMGLGTPWLASTGQGHCSCRASPGESDRWHHFLPSRGEEGLWGSLGHKRAQPRWPTAFLSRLQVWKLGWSPRPGGDFGTVYPEIPVEFLQEKEVLKGFIYRINTLGSPPPRPVRTAEPLP